MVFCTHIRETNQIFAHVENKSAEVEGTMTFKQGVSGNPSWQQAPYTSPAQSGVHASAAAELPPSGQEAIEKVARNQPAVYLKILALLVPRELKVEQSQGVKAMSDEQLEAGIEAITAMLAARDPGSSAKVIEAVPEPVPAPRKTQRKRRKTDVNMVEDMGSEPEAVDS
jgi:hypothetical protein